MSNNVIDRSQLTDDREWRDISDTAFRVYDFGGGDHVIVRYPMWLAVSDTGNHHIVDGSGNLHIIPPEWIHVRIQKRVGAQMLARF